MSEDGLLIEGELLRGHERVQTVFELLLESVLLKSGVELLLELFWKACLLLRIDSTDAHIEFMAKMGNNMWEIGSKTFKHTFVKLVVVGMQFSAWRGNFGCVSIGILNHEMEVGTTLNDKNFMLQPRSWYDDSHRGKLYTNSLTFPAIV